MLKLDDFVLIETCYLILLHELTKKQFAFIFEELEFNYVKIISKISTVLKKTKQ